MTVYIEAFEILGHSYGIEDYDDGAPDDDHFMRDHCRRNGRFHLWVSGGGFGYTNTLEKARAAVHVRAKDSAERQLATARKQLQDAERTLKALGDDPAYLFKFEEKPASKRRASRR